MPHVARALSALLLILATFGVAPATAADDSLRASVLRVDTTQFPWRDVYVSVSDPRGLPITGLGRDAFTVSEDGASQPIERFSVINDSQVPIAFGLIMDVSGSMNDEGKLEAAKGAARQLVAALGPADSAAVISFGDKAAVVQGYTSNHDDLNAAIDSLQAGGNTALYDAVLQSTLISQALPQMLKVQFIVTDGQDTKSSAHLNDVLHTLQSGPSVVYAVGLGHDVDRSVLDQITHSASGDALYTDDPSTLASAFQSVLNQLRLAYLLRYRSPVPSSASSASSASSDGVPHSVSADVHYQGEAAQAASTFTAASNAVAIDVTGLTPGETVSGDRQVRASLRSGTAQRIDMLVDGTTAASSDGQPTSIVTELEGLSPGDHDLAIRVADSVGAETVQHVPFMVPSAATPEPIATPEATPESQTRFPLTDAPWSWLVWLPGLLILLLLALLALVIARTRKRGTVSPQVAAAATDDTTLELAAPLIPAGGDVDTPRVRVEVDGQQQDVPLGADPVSIGRDADNTLVLHDPHVSRHHARITLDDGDYWIEDLKSQNGTLLNGQVAIDRRRLELGDQFAIGSATLTYLGQAPAVSPSDSNGVSPAAEPRVPSAAA